MKFVVTFAWQDLRGSGATLWLLCACVALGVTLVAATGALYEHVSHTLLADTRALLGGDLEVSARSPLPEPALAWMRARGRVSLLHELRTMLGTPNEQFTMVELQSVDQHYPLYGELKLDPERTLGAVTGKRDALWAWRSTPCLRSVLA